MNILIIGGLMGLAVLAILGAVLLGIGEDRSEKAKKELQAQQATMPALLPQQSQSLQTSSQGAAYPVVPATPLLSRPTITLPVSSAGETTAGHNLADLNGQVNEITGELRALAHRAGELQQRLTTLSDMLERKDQQHPEPARTSQSSALLTADTETQIL